jgi:hypothetical protein
MAADPTSPPPEPPAELVRTRRMATGVLAALAAVFLATHLVPDAPGWLRLVRAMAEAGMIGGLADWFAVEALFRHPLGIPIPHTALLPKNQARAAKNVGRFLSTHFLAPDQVEARLRAAEPARHLSGWLAQRDNARAVAAELTGMLAGMLHHEPSPRALARARQWLREQVADAGSDAAVAGGVADLVKAGMRGGVADAAPGLVRDAVDDNRERAVELVQDRSRRPGGQRRRRAARRPAPRHHRAAPGFRGRFRGHGRRAGGGRHAGARRRRGSPAPGRHRGVLRDDA